MKKVKIISIATLMAILMPTIIISVYFLCLELISASTGSINGSEFKTMTLIFLMTLLITGAHVIILGLPAIWVLSKLKKLNIWTVVFIGFIAGCIPVSIWSYPVDNKYKSGYSYWDGTETVISKIDGVPTLVGWIDYIQLILLMGALGIVSAFSFWLVLRRSLENNG